jgi:preprotein translocase subunit Sss1
MIIDKTNEYDDVILKIREDLEILKKAKKSSSKEFKTFINILSFSSQ